MNSDQVRDKVRDAYSAASRGPEEKHPFPVGRGFAESVGYTPDLLSRIPSASVSAFAGVSNVSVCANIPPGATVLDLGCGAGLDSFVAADRVGRTGTVIGVDFSMDMLDRARIGASEGAFVNTLFCRADAERLPVADNSIDFALVNGIFNLNPSRSEIFRELARVVRPSGTVFAAELILSQPLPPDQRQSEANWFA